MSVEMPRLRVMYSFSVEGKAAQLLRWTRLRGKISSSCVWQGAFPPEGEAEAAWRSALVAAQSEKALITASLPVSDTICRPLKTPFASVRKARKVFPSLLDIQLPFELADCCFTFLNTKEKQGQVHTLALAVRNTNLEKFLAGLKEYGLDPHLVFHEGMLLWMQSLREGADAKPERPRMVVWLGTERAVVLCGSGEELENASSLKFRCEDLRNDESQRVAWVRRLMLIVKAGDARTDDGVDWWWCGPCSVESETVALLESELGDALNIEFNLHRNPEWLLERAQAEACFNRHIDANLRNGGMLHSELVQRGQASRYSAVTVMLITGLLLCLLNMVWMIRVHSLQRSGERLIAETAREITGGGYIPRGQERYAVEQVLNEKSAYLRYFREVHEQKTPMYLQQLITHAAEQGVKVDLLDISDRNIKIEGSVLRWPAAVGLQNVLDGVGFDTRLTREGDDRGTGSRFLLRGVIDEPES